MFRISIPAVFVPVGQMENASVDGPAMKRLDCLLMDADQKKCDHINNVNK
jgi:hypothetical protein